ncbi:hypothetical protein AAG906_030914 [Vitis piasezkii]
MESGMAPSAFPELPEPREVPPPPLPSIFALSTSAPWSPCRGNIVDAPPVPPTSEPPITIPGAEYRALLVSFQTRTTTQTTIMEWMDHFQLRKDQSKEEKQRMKKAEDNTTVFLRTFGVLPKVHFLHSIYHFKSQEVKNPTLQIIQMLQASTKFAQHLLLVRNSHQPMRLCQTTSEDVFPEDERLNFWFLGVKEAR